MIHVNSPWSVLLDGSRVTVTQSRYSWFTSTCAELIEEASLLYSHTDVTEPNFQTFIDLTVQAIDSRKRCRNVVKGCRVKLGPPPFFVILEWLYALGDVSSGSVHLQSFFNAQLCEVKKYFCSCSNTFFLTLVKKNFFF